MILVIATIIYFIIGFGIGIKVLMWDWGGPWPPEIQGFMLVAMFWLPITLLALVLAISAEIYEE